MTDDELRAALPHPNVQAFLLMVRTGEGTADAAGYRRIVGGQLFDSYRDHPRVAVKTRYGWSSAAGAYQAMAAVPGKVRTDTWGDFVRARGPRDFSPASQDLFALWCIAERRGALADVLAGRVEVAMRKCAPEWASLPEATYGQRTVALADALATYARYGGRTEPAAVAEATPAATLLDRVLGLWNRWRQSA